MSDGGIQTSMSVPPSPADVMLPPYARRLDVRATRAAFAAGTLSTVSDDPASGDGERDAVARDADRDYPHDVQHRAIVAHVNGTRELARRARLARWQRVDPRERRPALRPGVHALGRASHVASGVRRCRVTAWRRAHVTRTSRTLRLTPLRAGTSHATRSRATCAVRLFHVLAGRRDS